MSAIADLSDFLNLATGGGSGAPEQIWTYKDGRVGAAAAVTVAGQFSSLWQHNGQNPSEGAAPGGTARNPTRATNGALGQANPGGGRQKWLAAMQSMMASINGTLYLADRLADISGLSGTVTTAQNTTSLAVSRYTGAASAGNEIWVEIYTAIGATARTITASYTNQDGTAGRTTVATTIGGSGRQEVQRLIRLPLQAGDTGVRSVESVTLSASTGTAGDFGVTIMRTLAASVAYSTGMGTARELTRGYPGLVEVLTDAALCHYWMASSTSAPQINVHHLFLEK